LRNYARYLGLDPAEASERYSALAAPPEPEPLPPDDETSPFEGPFRPVALHEMPGRRSRWLWIIPLGVVVVVALALLGWWSYPRVVEWLARPEPTERPLATATTRASSGDLATATHTSVATPATSTGTVAPDPATPTLELTLTPTFTPSPSPSPSQPVYTGIFLELVFTGTSWIQVTTDGVRQFQGELEAETYRSWYGEERIELRVGNAGAVLVTINGQSLGTLGAPGDVVDRVFEKVGGNITEATITPEPTSDGTAAPTTAPTAAPTVARPTATIQVTATIAPTEPITPTASP
jgi:cytoskeletal protein RodZ